MLQKEVSFSRQRTEYENLKINFPPLALDILHYKNKENHGKYNTQINLVFDIRKL